MIRRPTLTDRRRRAEAPAVRLAAGSARRAGAMGVDPWADENDEHETRGGVSSGEGVDPGDPSLRAALVHLVTAEPRALVGPARASWGCILAVGAFAAGGTVGSGTKEKSPSFYKIKK